VVEGFEAIELELPLSPSILAELRSAVDLISKSKRKS
jgi:hypothetical protein